MGLANAVDAVATSTKTVSRQEMIARDAQVLKIMQTRVAVLQDLLAQEIDRLRKSEEQFAKAHNLDLQLFREGRYEYKTKKDKFIVLPPPADSKKTPK